MNQRLTGAALRGGGGAGMPMAAPQGPTGADLAMGGSAPPPGGDGGMDIDQALQTVIQAAQQAGFQLPQQQVPPDQLPQVYQQLLAAAAQSPLGQSQEGMALIAAVAQALGLSGGGSPPPDMGAGMGADMGAGMPPQGGMMPPR